MPDSRRVRSFPRATSHNFIIFHLRTIRLTAKTWMLLPVQHPGGCSNSSPLSFTQGGDEYSHLGIRLPFRTVPQSFAAVMSQVYISHLWESLCDFPPGAGSEDHGVHQAQQSPFPYSQCQLKPVPNTPAGTNSQNWAQREFWLSSLAASQLRDLGATSPLLLQGYINPAAACHPKSGHFTASAQHPPALLKSGTIPCGK